MNQILATVALAVLAFAPEASSKTPGAAVSAAMAPAMKRAQSLPRLRALIIARHGTVLAEKAFRGSELNVPVNVKSVSKSVISALVGIAVSRGALTGADQPVDGLLADRLPQNPDPRLRKITLDHLLSMRSGLDRTSGRNYGRWVQSRDWVRHVLSRGFADEPGGRMLYSTGNTHVLSAILTRATGRTTLDLARDWLGKPLGISVPAWQRDPQGIYLGGNNMLLSPRALLRFGELYRDGGVYRGQRILAESWVADSWRPRTRSPFSGDEYGLGWFITEICGETVAYARGFGGQFVYISRSLGLTVVITSDPTKNTRVDGYRADLRTLLYDDIVPAVIKADGKTCT